MNLNIPKHIAIVGDTQSGKTVLANHIYKKSTRALVIDIEDVGQFEGKHFNIDSTATELISHLQKEGKAVYVPSTDKKDMKQEIGYLWQMLMYLKMNIIVFVDETQHYGDARNNLFDTYAVRGLKHGVHLCSISQRVANISKTIMNNTPKIVFFDLGEYERKYFTEYGLGSIYDEVSKLREYPDYTFLIYEKGKGISEPYKLSL